MALLEKRPGATRNVPSPKVSIVIPALNEAENLPHVLATLPVDTYELVLVDGHSVDGTSTVAREHYPSVRIVGQPGRGKGDALRAGFAACSGDVIVMMDADGSTDGGEIERFVAALVDGADYAKGSRFMDGGGSEDITFLRRAGNRLLCGVVNLLFTTSYTDLCYGYNAFWRNSLPAIMPDCRGFEVETLLNVRAAKAGLRVVEVPSVEHPRIHGESKLHPVRDGLRVLRTILREWGRRPGIEFGEAVEMAGAEVEMVGADLRGA
ncbi:MAG TPA: glycosyltransferase family 2 protein [Gaiellaceae bacterium]|nr:glycosyltransferase family 2 protein [Gaiellaceae bacterium]